MERGTNDVRYYPDFTDLEKSIYQEYLTVKQERDLLIHKIQQLKGTVNRAQTIQRR